MKILLLFSFLLASLMGGLASAVMVSHHCSIAEVRSGSGPCICPITELTPPFCPRLEGIKLPCITKIKIGSCSYDNGEPEPAVCLVAKSCDGTSQGACKAPLESYNCDETKNGACLATESYDCSTTEQGSCTNYSEAGVCLGYAQVVISKTCDRCTSYETITLPKTCQRCSAGYEQVPVHYDHNEAMCGCETYSTP